MIKREFFKKPSPEFRGAPFWSINDKLDPKEVMRQVALLKEGGYGGAFFHAREGLVTSFLGEEWFKSFKAAVDKAKEFNMYIWIYDELRWPSGFAGGIVPALDAEYRAKALLMIPSERAYGGKEVIANFKCKLDEKGIPLNYEETNPGEEGGDYIYLTFMLFTASIGETWFNGLSYVDLLNREAVKKFLEVAYEPYVKHLKEEFGKTIPGVFTDEPNVSSSRPRPPSILPPRGPRIPPFSVPWTNDLAKRFMEMNGYSIVDKLPELFFDIGDYMKTRYDFWKTVTMLFLESFSKQIYEWCDKHGLKFTGHYLAEDRLLSQLVCAGAVMPHYEYQHVPGIDHLGMHIWGTLLTIKQVSSVANQLGKRRVLCETYGCTGNYPSFADRKWIGDWLYVMGVNLLNHHLVPYSMRGRRKKDYGLNFHWSQPWWKYNRVIEDYFARLSYMLSRGKRVINVLVIHPIGSAWALYSPVNTSKVMELDDSLLRLLRSLLSAHIDFDLGDEMLMKKYGEVRDGRIVIGEMSYDAVVVPPSITLAANTVSLLKEFVDSGGIVVAVAPTPYMIEGKPSEEIKALFKKAKIIEKINPATLSNALKNVVKPIMIEGDENGDILYHLRKDEEQYILFLANTSRERTHDIEICMNGKFRIEEWDPLSGEIKSRTAKVEDEKTLWRTRINPIGSRMFVLKPLSSMDRGDDFPQTTNEREPIICEITLEGPWKIKRINPNILVLDYCRYRIKGAWSEVMPVWKAHDLIVKKGLGASFSLRFEFESEVDFGDRVRSAYLVIENPENFKIEVNGVRIEPKADGYWLDWNFPMIDISNALSRGLNTIELEGTVNLEPEIENIYLLGDFAVKAGAKGSSRLIEESREIEIGNLCEKGYPFYAGEIELEREVYIDAHENARAFIRLEDLNTALAIVYVNDREAGKVMLPPYEVEVTDGIKHGINKIKVVLVGTLRNALGPLHYEGGDPAYISRETFRDPSHWTDEYVLKPFGIGKVKMLLY